jgi:kinesin family protein C1
LNAVNTAVPKTVDSLAKDAEILEMRNALTAKEEDIKDLARKLDEAATSAFVAKEVTSQELAAVQEEIAKADAETQDCRMQITLKENEVLALMAQIGALNEQIRAGRGVTVALQLQLSSLESEVAATKAEILRVSKELHVTSIGAMQSDSANAMLRNEVSAISAAKQTLQCQLDAFQLEHAALETKEREVREALAESVLQIHALEQQLLLAQSERTTAQSEAAALRICIETLNIEREGLQQALDNKTAQLKQDAAENGALRAEIETLSMKTRDYEQTVQMLTVEQDLRARAETREESERRERIASVAQLLAVQTDSANKIRFAEEKAMAAVEHVERDLLETRTLLADKGKALMTAQDEGLSRLREIEALQLQLQGASSNSKSQEELAALQGEMEVVKKRLKDREAVDTTDVVKALARVRELEAELVAAESERRRLRSLIAELKGNVRVFARVRPFLPGDGDTAVNTLSESTVVVNEDTCSMRVCNLGERREDAIFSFDKTYGPSTSQDRIFSDVSEYVQSALDGYNGMFMCMIY